MMGVKNLKLTLSNRSNLTINSAKVEVLYYSEQNNLLDKKILSFSNIPPGKSQTLPAPDQRLADHIEYKILSANGVDNAYARQ
jgi:P pilus assembly chaperone PapD